MYFHGFQANEIILFESWTINSVESKEKTNVKILAILIDFFSFIIQFRLFHKSFGMLVYCVDIRCYVLRGP
jgi:hypothetical protein